MAVLFVVLTFSGAAFAGGSGTSSDPYEISTCQQLQDMNTDLDANYELVNDVDCSGFSYTSVGETSSSGTPFTGVLDGHAHEVKNLTINEGSLSHAGLISYIDGGGEVKNIGVVNAEINGSDYVGGLAGYNGGIVSNIYITGSIFANNSYVGGLVGWNGGNISNSYNIGSVSGSETVGGLVGRNAENVSNSYSIGSVSGDSYVGGLVGRSPFGNAYSSYWDTESSGQSSSDGGTGLTTSEMTGSSATSNMNFDFSSTWETVEASDSLVTSDGYPILQYLSKTNQLAAQGVLYESPQFDSTGVSPDPFVIGDSLSYSGSASGGDGTVENISLTVFQDRSQVYSDTVSSSSNTWSDVYVAEEGDVDARFVATDNEGATTTEWINRTLSDSSPANPVINLPDSSTKNEENVSYDISTSSDGDDKLNEQVDVVLKEDGTQVGSHTVTEGDSVSGSYTTSGEGSHTFEAEVIETDDSQSTAETVSYNVNISPDSPTNPSPLEGKIRVNTSPVLSVDVSDFDGDSMDVRFYDASDDSQIGSTQTDVANGSTASLEWSNLDWGTTYEWYAVADEGDKQQQSETFNFTTNYAPDLNTPNFVVNRSSSVTKLLFSVDDYGESDIDTWSGSGTLNSLSNSELDADVSLPVSNGYTVSDTLGAVSNTFNIDLSETDSGVREDSYSHSLDTQRINRTVSISNGASSSVDYQLVLDLGGSVVQGQSWSGTISGSSNVTHTAVTESDWILNEDESSVEIGQNLSAQSDIDQQVLYNQSNLQVNNTRNFSFSGVDVSSKCSLTGSVDVPSGTNTVTDSCNNESISDDWIVNEENQSTEYVSGDVVLGKDLSTKYTASQGVDVTNVRTDEDLEVDLGKLVSDVPGCNLQNSTTQNVPADSVSSFTFHKSCSPGQHLNRTPVIKTETSDSFKYEIEFGFKINSNLTEEQETEYAVKSSWVDNWNSRDPTETEAVVDGNGKDIQVDERIIDGTEYIVFQIGDQHTNSSIHTGTHSATLTYYESKTTGSTSGGGDTTSSGGTTLIGGGQTETRVDENNGSAFAWSVSAITSQDAQSFQVNGYPGDSFEKYVVLRNEGDRNVTLNIECVSDTGFCSYVDTDLDNVVLNRNSFSEKEIKVSGTLPMNFSQRDRPATFGIRVTDPDWNGTSRTGESVSYVDFTVSNSPFAGRALDLAFKIVELRSFESPFEQGNDVPYPFIFIPLFLSILTWGGVSTGEWLFAKKSYSNLKIGVTLLVFLIAFVLL